MCNPVAEFKCLAERVAAKVEIAIFSAKFLATIANVLNCERRGLCLVEYLDFREFNLDVTRRHLRVFARPLDNLSGSLNHIFASERAGGLRKLLSGGCVNHQLCDAISVTEIDESHTPELTAFLHPSGQRHRLSSIGKPQLTASLCSIHIL